MMKKTGIRVLIGVFAFLMVASAGGLLAKHTFWNVPVTEQTAAVPEELLSEELVEGNLQTFAQAGGNTSSTTAQATAGEAASIELYQGNAEVNRRFETGNMLPGDVETGYFCVKVHHQQPLSLFFSAEVTEQTKNLADVLFVRVTRMDSKEVVCDAPLSEVQKEEYSTLLPKAENGESVVYYQVDVYADTSIGNEYQGAALKADLNWYVKDDGSLTPPPTGDNSNRLLWIVLAGSAVMLAALLWRRNRKEEVE